MESLHSPHTQVSRDQTVYSWLLLMVPSYVPSPDSTLHYASLLCLHLLRAALPFIKLAGGTTSQQPPSDLLSLPSAILAHLCGLLDSADVDTTVQRLAQDIVVEGVVVFFPDASTRREYLLNMIGAVLVRWRKVGGAHCVTQSPTPTLLQEDSQPRSWWLKFEALCRYFSKSDCNSLLSLPQKLQEVGPCPPPPGSKTCPPSPIP